MDLSEEEKSLAEEVGREIASLTRRVQPVGWGELRKGLAEWVNGLISENFEELVRILYRIDINENKLKFLLKEKVGEDADLIIADLIIERQLQKIKSRRQYQQPPPDDEEEERW